MNWLRIMCTLLTEHCERHSPTLSTVCRGDPTALSSASSCFQSAACAGVDGACVASSFCLSCWPFERTDARVQTVVTYLVKDRSTGDRLGGCLPDGVRTSSSCRSGARQLVHSRHDLVVVRTGRGAHHQMAYLGGHVYQLSAFCALGDVQMLHLHGCLSKPQRLPKSRAALSPKPFLGRDYEILEATGSRIKVQHENTEQTGLSCFAHAQYIADALMASVYADMVLAPGPARHGSISWQSLQSCLH